MVRAIEHVPNVNLVIAGHGACHDSLQTDIIARGLADRVVLLGHRPDLYSLMKSADVFCHPSTEEGMGQVVAEALIAGVPVVATRAGGVPEVVGEDGWLVPPGDCEGLAQGITDALTHKRARQSQEAQYRVREGFSADTMVTKTTEAYASLCSGM